MENNKQQTMQEKDLKAFLATFIVDGIGEPKDDLLSVIIIAFTKEEAGKLFVRWAKAKNLYEHITAIVVQRTRKTKHNKHLITLEYYNKQNTHVDNLERKVIA